MTDLTDLAWDRCPDCLGLLQPADVADRLAELELAAELALAPVNGGDVALAAGEEAKA